MTIVPFFLSQRTLRLVVFLVLATSFLVNRTASAAPMTEVSQYGITWKFDGPHEAGQFITGDWWVVGPVRVTAVTPVAGPAGPKEPEVAAASRYGATAFQANREMRNGSMLDPMPGGDQGYDSRPLNYNADLSAHFPLDLAPGHSLISSVSSNEMKVGKDGKPALSTPYILGELKIPLCSSKATLALESAAILSCLDKAPPADAFRPPYSGTDKPIYREKDLHWDLLPKLAPVASTPAWETMERIFQRPWLDHANTWFGQYWLPGENQPNYGREFARMTSMGGLMLLLDVPKEQKRKLLVEYVQLGIDLAVLAQNGRQWFSDGGHWQGRKWPILFASLMLGDERLRTFPPVPKGKPIYGRIQLDPAAPPTSTLFQEDLDTYYGKGGDGQTVLWQIVFHTGPRAPYQEKARATFDKGEEFLDAYQMNNAASDIGPALAAQYLKAKGIWNHDAFFDFADQWMRPDNPVPFPAWLPKGCHRGVDLFAEEMWVAYRAGVPAQQYGSKNLKWIYTDGTQDGDHFWATKGMWTENSPKLK